MSKSLGHSSWDGHPSLRRILPFTAWRKKGWLLAFWELGWRESGTPSFSTKPMPCTAGMNFQSSLMGREGCLGRERMQVSNCFINRLPSNPPLLGPTFTPTHVPNTPIPQFLSLFWHRNRWFLSFSHCRFSIQLSGASSPPAFQISKFCCCFPSPVLFVLIDLH